MFVKILQLKLFPPTPHTLLFESKSLSSHKRCGELHSTLLGRQCTSIFWPSSVRESLLHLFIQSFIYISMDLWIIYIILWVAIQCYVIYFFTQTVPALDIGSSFRLGLCPFDIPDSILVFEYFTFWFYKMLQAHLVY